MGSSVASEKGRWIDAEGGGQQTDVVEGCVPLASLNCGDERSVKAGLGGEGFLREVPFGAKATNVGGEDGSAHDGRYAFGRLAE
jgi:hypothetical protein